MENEGTPPELPDDVLRLVCDCVAWDGETEATARTLRSLSRTAKVFRDALPPSCKRWTDLMRALFEEREWIGWQEMTWRMRAGGLSPKQAVLLLIFSEGCQLCGAHKHGAAPPDAHAHGACVYVHWAFRVRCCHACFVGHTIDGAEIAERFGLKWKHLADLPRTRPATHNLRGEVMYWKQDVLLALRTACGIEFQDLCVAEEHMTRQRNERNQEMFSVVLRLAETCLVRAGLDACQMTEGATLTDLRRGSRGFDAACSRPLCELSAQEYAQMKATRMVALALAERLIVSRRSERCPQREQKLTYKQRRKRAAARAAMDEASARERYAAISAELGATYDAVRRSYKCGCSRREFVSATALVSHARSEHGLLGVVI